MAENTEERPQLTEVEVEVDDTRCCSSCQEKLQEELAFRCRDCETNDTTDSVSNLQICDTCVGWHVKKLHAVVDYRGHDADICTQHRIVRLFYCEDCESVLCSKCLLDHRGHNFTALHTVASEARKKVFKLLGLFEEREKLFSHTNDVLIQTQTEFKEEMILSKDYVVKQTKTVADLILEKCSLIKLDSTDAENALDDSKVTLKVNECKEIASESDANEQGLLCLLPKSDSSLVTEIKRKQTNCNETIKKRARLTEKHFYVAPFSFDQSKVNDLVSKFAVDFVDCLTLPTFEQEKIRQLSERSVKLNEEFAENEQSLLSRYREGEKIFDFEQTEDGLQITCWKNDQDLIKYTKDDCIFEGRSVVKISLSGSVRFIQPVADSNCVFIATTQSVVQYNMQTAEEPVLKPEINWNDFEYPLAIHDNLGVIYWDLESRSIKASLSESMQLQCMTEPRIFCNHFGHGFEFWFQMNGSDLIFLNPMNLTTLIIPFSLHHFPQIDWIHLKSSEENGFEVTLLALWCCSLKLIKVFKEKETDQNFSIVEVYQWESDDAASFKDNNSSESALDPWYLHLKFKKRILKENKAGLTDHSNDSLDGFIVL